MRPRPCRPLVRVRVCHGPPDRNARTRGPTKKAPGKEGSPLVPALE